MNKYWLDLANESSVPNAYQFGSDFLMNRTGQNVGNFVFRKAVSSLLDNVSDFQLLGWSKAKNVVFDDNSEIIISCANWLGMSDKDEQSNLTRAKVVENLSGKCIVLGLGSQASSGQELSFGPNTCRLARALSSKTTALSVRDLNTANALRGLGITNVVVTGCPSNFINTQLTKDLFERNYLQKSTSWRTAKLFISEASGGNPLSGKVVKRMLSILSQSPGSRYVLQSPQLLKYLYRESDIFPAFYERAIDSSPQIAKAIIKNSSQVFSSVDEWLFSASFHDLSFGMRIHGTMIPLQAGVPSVLIAHDKRTSGLASTMSIPSLSCDQFLDSQAFPSPFSFLELFMDNLDAYFARRYELAFVFKELIEANGFQVSDSFSKLCQVTRR
ncbi:polysaccharide pyruvyl transferase family protein [Synechococcus sp. RS9902]|uniref:polysaccharide pyruvyl transferase family protein n=1 Tax=Synechococcus sp. RS9902 TaxID=221345 RepID=UPI001647EB3C|nr:polysaccharide pyruvyl transferase family protein [Synechococcus sp. RS9902]QNI96562.1 polysaccharide pyruvyl transferase family protein [Synechococcus sp. RS9902]